MSEAFAYNYQSDDQFLTKKELRKLRRREQRDENRAKRQRRSNHQPVHHIDGNDRDQPEIGIHHLVKGMKHLMPRTENQKLFQQAFNNNIPLISQIGSPGVGKTHFAIYLSLKAVLSGEVPQTKVIVYQSATPSIDQGYLPGSLDEKSAPYANPSREGIESLFAQPTAYKFLVEKDILEFRTTGYERGRNNKDAIVIIDEGQNLDYQNLETLITRVDENSRVILCADERQTDVQLRKSGLKKYIRVLAEMDRIEPGLTAVIQYTPDDCLRHSLIKTLLKAAQKIELEESKIDKK